MRPARWASKFYRSHTDRAFWGIADQVRSMEAIPWIGLRSSESCRMQVKVSKFYRSHSSGASMGCARTSLIHGGASMDQTCSGTSHVRSSLCDLQDWNDLVPMPWCQKKLDSPWGLVSVPLWFRAKSNPRSGFHGSSLVWHVPWMLYRNGIWGFWGPGPAQSRSLGHSWTVLQCVRAHCAAWGVLPSRDAVAMRGCTWLYEVLFIWKPGVMT